LFVLRDADRARSETQLEVVAVSGWRELWIRARDLVGAGRIGLTLDVLCAAHLRTWGSMTSMPQQTSVRISLRYAAGKSPWEIGRLEETGRVAADVFRHATEILRPGMTEVEFAGLLFAHAMKLGHEGLLRTRGSFEAYSWHVLSGRTPHVPVPSIRPCRERACRRPSPGRRTTGYTTRRTVIVDFG